MGEREILSRVEDAPHSHYSHFFARVLLLGNAGVGLIISFVHRVPT